jgi:transposase-like protein
MKPVSYKRYRFPPEVIRYAVWLYFRFTLSLRDVEELLAERGIEGCCQFSAKGLCLGRGEVQTPRIPGLTDR